MLTQKKLISLLLIILLLVSLFLTLILVSKRQEIRKRAASSQVTLALYPATENIPLGQERAFELKATFTGGSATEKLDYLKTEIVFSREYLRVSEGRYIETSFTTNQTNFDKIFRVDGPQAANDSGKVIIELGVTTPGGGPPTDRPLTIARVYFKGVKQTPSAQDLTIGTTEIVNNQSNAIPPAFTSARYTVGTAAVSSPTPEGASPTRIPPSPTPSRTPTPTLRLGGVSSSPTVKPPSPTPTRKATPSPTVPATGVVTPSPTGGQKQGIIDIGDKDSLTINIGGGTSPTVTSSVPLPTGVVDPDVSYIRFAIRLFGTEQTPEIKVRLKVVDLASRLAPASSLSDSCQESPPGQYFYTDIPMVAGSDGVYYPKKGGIFTYNSSAFSVATDGWVPLPEVAPGKVYSLSVKGPKHRNVEMVRSFSLGSGRGKLQNFDWSGNPLEPGDLPDPNTDGRQDCIVNSIDLSLIIDRIGATEKDDLLVADVNYDGVVNGNDVSKVVATLSTKPDDD